jgi:hypothetical protein
MNKVWIEIERDANKSINHKRAEKFTDLLANLGSTKKVWFNEEINQYCLVTDRAGSFFELENNGYWFNLDEFLAQGEQL